MRPILKQQEVPYDHPDSNCMIDPDADDLAVAITPAARAIYNDYAYELLAVLTDLAKRHHGLDRLQIFMSQAQPFRISDKCQGTSVCRCRVFPLAVGACSAVSTKARSPLIKLFGEFLP